MGKLVLPFATTALRSANTPIEAELLYDQDNQTVYLGDGVTLGGIPVFTSLGSILTDISNLQTDVGQLQIDVGNNDTDILALQTAVGTNTTNISTNTADITQLQIDLGNIDDTTDISLGTITAINVPINSSTGTGITTLPAATATLAGIITAQAQTFGGRKTFNDDRIIIDAPSATGTLEIGWFNDLTPSDPNAYGIRRNGGAGYLAFMNNSINPQLVAGSPTGTNQFFIDTTNNGNMFLNTLDTGLDDPGRVTIGIGGLTVAGSSELSPTNPLSVFRDSGTPILSFEVESDGTLTVGTTAAYETLVTSDNHIPNKKYVDDSIPTIIYSNVRVQSVAADQTINYNINGTPIPLALTGTPVNRGTGGADFSYDGAGNFTCNFTGDVRVSFGVPYTSTGARASLQCTTLINATNSGASISSYIRSATGHNRAANSDSDIFSVTTGDIIAIGVRRTVGSTQGAAINILPRTRITIERLT